ncbi:hypothetical protein N692_01545 [Lactiplantibacillus plantarum EGD-AQ4]|nr:hypothetical protein KCA1_1417 [Lactiplantibacillus pentosus KCA1]EQM55574.1 hypothetical protein N692_01545 [Lactiplantibacillus plantarum EGD-AQ4]
MIVKQVLSTRSDKPIALYWVSDKIEYESDYLYADNTDEPTKG